MQFVDSHNLYIGLSGIVILSLYAVLAICSRLATNSSTGYSCELGMYNPCYDCEYCNLLEGFVFGNFICHHIDLVVRNLLGSISVGFEGWNAAYGETDL